MLLWLEHWFIFRFVREQLLKVLVARITMGCQQSMQAQSHYKNKQMAQSDGVAEEPQSPMSVDSEWISQSARASRRRQGLGPQKLFTEAEKLQDKLVGVIVTIYEGSSYDAMFREVQPTTVPGERISTYSISCSEVEKMHVFLASLVPIPEDQVMWRALVDDVRQGAADSVVFNWECCSGCGDCAFPRSHGPCLHPAQGQRQQQQRTGPSATMQFMGFALRSGFTVMCSDFSLKSLIHEWSEEHLGPNPFLQVGECDEQICLEFVPSDLSQEEVPQQLQVVGELCADSGKAVVTAMGSTIVYTVNPNRKPTQLYDLKVLTVATDYCRGSFPSIGDGEMSDNMKCAVGEGANQKRGVAGHVTLTYAEGGQLVTSMGHWIELTRIDATVESVMRVAEHNFGGVEAENFRKVYMEQATDADRSEWVQKSCHKYVTQSAPTRMKCRTKFEA
jgi:NAD-dependent dihydropyrimidine dehydrogenase PreA subunit